MMISELKDDEILEFLMTSDFEDSYSPDELKYLIFKFRYFYRLLHGQLERKIEELDFNSSKFENIVKDLQNDVQNLMINNAKSEDLISSLKSRRLTLKERLSGKIIQKEDENK